MKEVDDKLKKYEEELPIAENRMLNFDNINEGNMENILQVLNYSAYLHHVITHIHPFRDGNGRTARLAGNLVLERYGIIGLSIKVEKENKNRYRNALSQIDKHGNYEPLLDLMMEGIIDRYNGVTMKFLKL